jgi:bifunctional DNA-binding transcriptional regulator/antitoxin component of YhaV-PrlF toxin-antitoxin module
MTEQIVSVTKKGQATIPKEMRERHGIGRRALVVEVEEGILVKALPKPSVDRGSLKTVFGGKTSREVLVEIRKEELRRQRQLLRHIKG